MKERDILKIEASKSGNTELFLKYKEKRNLVTTKLKTAKVDYYKDKFYKNDKTPGEVWKAASQIMGKVRSSFPSQIVINGKLLSKPIDMVTEMNKFFVKITKCSLNS